MLAAGFGTRLEPLTAAVPKPLLPVGNLPLIGYALKLLARHGIHEVGVNLHHLGDQVREALGDGSRFGVEITYSDEEEILGTGGGLRKMQDFFDGTFVVLNADTIVDVDLTGLVERHRQRDAMATMVLRKDPAQEDYGQVEIDGAARIRRMLGHGPLDLALDAYMFAGVHILEPHFLDYIPPGINTCINRYAYIKALNNGDPIYGDVMTGYWADVGTPERYWRANVDALDHRINLPHADALGGYALAPTKSVDEVVRMGRDVELGTDVRIVPPVLLGDDARIGDRATIGPYVIVGERVHVGREAQVSEALLLDGTKVDAGARIRRELIGKKGGVAFEVQQ